MGYASLGTVPSQYSTLGQVLASVILLMYKKAFCLMVGYLSIIACVCPLTQPINRGES